MRHLVLLLSLSLACLQAYAEGADGSDVSFQCPCSVNSDDGVSASLTMGAVNISDSTVTLEADIYVHLDLNYDVNTADRIGIAIIDTLDGNSTLSSASYNFDLPQQGFSDTYYMTVHLVANNTVVDQIHMQEQVTLSGGFATSAVDLLQDSDGDGVADYNETLAGTDLNDANSTPGASTIDVMAIYDASLPETYNGDHQARIDHIFTVSNTALTDSNVNMQLRLVESREIDTLQPYEDMLNDGNNAADAYAELPDLRTQFGADLISILTTREDSPEPSCGVATLGGIGSNDEAAMEGFMNASVHVNVNNVVFNGCDDMTLLHEIGHNMGLAHSAAQNESGSFIWGRGYGENDRFYTVMAYDSAFGTNPTQIQVVSNPEVTLCDGSPCGIAVGEANASNAAVALDIVRFQVERYRDAIDSGNGNNGGGSGTGGSSGSGSDPDTDGDGIPDIYENFLGSDPDVSDAAADANNNGDTNLEEFSALPTATQYLQTTSTSNNVTSIHLVNMSETAQTFTGTLYTDSGARQGFSDVTLSSTAVPAKGRQILSSSNLESVFGVSAWSGPAMLEVRGTQEFSLMAKLVSPSGLISNTNCVREDRVVNIEGFESTNRTFVRFINTGSSDLGPITGTLYDTNGDVIGTPGVTLLDSLKAKGQTWINREGFSQLVGSEWNGEAMLEVDGQSGLKLLNLNFVNNETFFNFSCFQDNDNPWIYLQTNSASNNVSLTHIINTDDTQQQFTGTLYNGSGEQQGIANQPLHSGMIPSRGRAIISSEDLESVFGVSAWPGPAIIKVDGIGSFELMTRLTSPSLLVSNTNCVRGDQVHNIEDVNSEQTFIRFINIGDSAMTDITGTVYDSDGTIVGNQNQVLVDTLPAKGAVWVNRDKLAELVGDTWTGEAMMEVESLSDLRLLNLNFVNDETFFNFSCYEGSQ